MQQVVDVSHCARAMYNIRRAITPTTRIRGRALMAIRADHLHGEPLCRRCRAKGRVTEAQHVDHIIPLEHGGEEEPENRQSLCVPCHKEKTAEDRNYKPQGCDANGNPTDPRHPWNR